MGGVVRPYNEYFIVGYIAKMTVNSTTDPTGKAAAYWSTYFAADGSQPPVGDGTYPYHLNYWGYDLLTDNGNKFMSSFIPQFCYFMTKAFGVSPYYKQVRYSSRFERRAPWHPDSTQAYLLVPAHVPSVPSSLLPTNQPTTDRTAQLLSDWLDADMAFWAKALPDDAEVWGVPGVKGQVWGCGAGMAPSGYSDGFVERIDDSDSELYHVERIDDSDDLVFSAAIMAGFVGVAKATNVTLQQEINGQLQWLYDNDVCAYTKALPTSSGTTETVKVLWRCSVAQPDWRAASADSTNFATMLLGYSENWLPDGYYSTYAS